MNARLLILVAATVLLLAVAGARAETPAPVEFQGPPLVQASVRQDVDGDGCTDVLLLQERTVWVFMGRKGALPAPKARWTVDLPPDVSFVDVAPRAPTDEDAALLVLGQEGLRRLSLETGKETPWPKAEASLSWVDGRRVTFVRMAQPDGSLLVPTDAGWTHLSAWWADEEFIQEIVAPRFRELRPPGAFLEDVGVVVNGLPHVFLSVTDEAPTYWTLAGTDLAVRFDLHHTRHDLSFLPASGDRHLVDLDGNGTPEIIHTDGTNQEGTYSIFRTPLPALVDGRLPTRGPDLRPAASVLRLSGYRLDPDFVDLDGDGDIDFVVTTIPIDARNTLRALGGKVTASTRAFLNRSPGPTGSFYPAQPDADIVSDVGVAVRFSQAGNIAIERSFTILATGDHDGDGRKDLVIRTGPETLTVRRGIADGVWEKEGRAVSIPPMGACPNIEGFAVDLDGDGADEVMLLYRAPHGGRDRVWAMEVL